jgi:hypothetical protein
MSLPQASARPLAAETGRVFQNVPWSVTKDLVGLFFFLLPETRKATESNISPHSNPMTRPVREKPTSGMGHGGRRRGHGPGRPGHALQVVHGAVQHVDRRRRLSAGRCVLVHLRSLDLSSSPAAAGVRSIVPEKKETPRRAKPRLSVPRPWPACPIDPATASGKGARPAAAATPPPTRPGAWPRSSAWSRPSRRPGEQDTGSATQSGTGGRRGGEGGGGEP